MLASMYVFYEQCINVGKHMFVQKFYKFLKSDAIFSRLKKRKYKIYSKSGTELELN